MKSFDCLIRRSVLLIMVAVLILAAIASVTQFFLKHFAKLDVVGWSSLLVYTVGFTALVLFCAQSRAKASENRIAALIIGITLIMKLAIVAAWSQLPQTGDHLYLLSFVDRWVTGGDEALRQLSREVHDYPVWSGRAWPFLFPLRMLFPTRFVLATQLFNCILSTALLIAIYALTRRLVTRPLLPLAFAALTPTFFWNVLGYAFAYRFQGTLFILAAFAALSFLLHTSETTWRTLSISVGLGLTLFLLHLQQGLDFVIVAAILATLIYAACQQHGTRKLARVGLYTLVLPVAIMLPLSKTADHWLAARNQGKLSAGFLVHMAYGWNLVTWGEYYAPVVALDVRTPPEQKHQVMISYIQQQIREHPFNALVRLPLVKVIKLFQLGASSGMEEKLTLTNHSLWPALCETSRLVFAPIVLLLAAIGCRQFLGSGEPERMLWILLVLDFTVAYTFFSEVSPNYSFYFQFVLFACAAEGIIALRGFFPHRERVPD